MNIENIGFRIKQAIGLTGFNVKEFCEKTDRSRTSTALWIAGQGSIIKKESLLSLCYDLKKVGVICSSQWILTGVGYPPTISSKTAKEKVIIDDNKIRELQHIININDQSLFEVDNESTYCLCLEAEKKSCYEEENTIFAISYKNKSEYSLYTVNDICDNKTKIIIKDKKRRLFCIKINDIRSIGRVIFMVEKI